MASSYSCRSLESNGWGATKKAIELYYKTQFGKKLPYRNWNIHVKTLLVSKNSSTPINLTV